MFFPFFFSKLFDSFLLSPLILPLLYLISCSSYSPICSSLLLSFLLSAHLFIFSSLLLSLIYSSLLFPLIYFSYTPICSSPLFCPSVIFISSLFFHLLLILPSVNFLLPYSFPLISSSLSVFCLSPLTSMNTCIHHIFFSSPFIDSLPLLSSNYSVLSFIHLLFSLLVFLFIPSPFTSSPLTSPPHPRVCSYYLLSPTHLLL